MVKNTSRGRMALGVGEGKFVLISGFSRLATGTAITLAQGSKGVNPLRTEAAKVAGSSRGSKRHKWCGNVVGPTEFGRQIGGDWISWVNDKLGWWQW